MAATTTTARGTATTGTAGKGTAARLRCGGCDQEIPLDGQRIGDTVRCPGCARLRVVIRSRVTGEVAPAATQAGALRDDEMTEVQDALTRIRARRLGHTARHVPLYPSWAVFVAGAQFYLSGILAGQNLIAVGQARAGRWLQVVGVASYVVAGALLLAALLLLRGPAVPPALRLGLLVGGPLLIPLAFALYFTAAQARACKPARDAGAPRAPVLLPLLLGLILAVAQVFALSFIWSMDRWNR